MEDAEADTQEPPENPEAREGDTREPHSKGRGPEPQARRRTRNSGEVRISTPTYVDTLELANLGEDHRTVHQARCYRACRTNSRKSDV